MLHTSVIFVLIFLKALSISPDGRDSPCYLREVYEARWVVITRQILRRTPTFVYSFVESVKFFLLLILLRTGVYGFMAGWVEMVMVKDQVMNAT